MAIKFSKAGKYHNNESERNEDVIQSGENNNFSVITLADGVSTCKNAKEGAKVASEAITELFLRKGEHFLSFEKETIAYHCILHILHKLRETTERTKEVIDAYSSTIASVVLDKQNNQLMYFNLGDGLILSTRDDEFHILARPSCSSLGCPVTTTKNAWGVVDTEIIDLDGMNKVWIFSDGAWKQLMDRNTFKPEVKEWIRKNDHKSIEKYLENRNGLDDYSFIILDVGEASRKEVA